MALTKQQKEKIIEDLKEKIESQKSMAFVDFKGLKVKDLSVLRKQVKEIGGQLKVAKKTLINLALEKFNLKLEGETHQIPAHKLWPGLSGQVAIIFAFEDPILPLKKAYQFSQTNENLKIISGIFDGRFIGKEEILTLAQLPNREELLTKLVGSIANPISGLLNVLQGNIKGLIRVLAYAKT
jgi:large subunit ribosomal protein L10